MTPSKRQVDEDDDDIQFISEKPVKRRRISEKQPTTAIPTLQQPMIPFAAIPDAASTVVPNIPTVATQVPENDLKNMERRLSTGMVGLPSDIHAVELTYALRGVSMPVLENFVLNQPFRKPRPPSPPELSPKQLPSTISPAMISVQSDQPVPTADFEKPPSPQMLYASSNHACCRAGTPAIMPGLIKATTNIQQSHALETPINSRSPVVQISSNYGTRVGLNSSPMPPPPPPVLPYSEASHHAPCSGNSQRPSENHHHHNSSAHPQKQPCQVCFRLRRQAQLSRVQGFPIVNAALPPHLMPQFHYHPSHPQVMAEPTSNVHRFEPDLVSVMIPNNGSPFAPLAPHSQPATAQQQQKAEEEGQPIPERSGNPGSPQKTPLNTTAVNPSATSSPIKPPASLIQPTYRKPSPNLIVDVAETCQQKFPFEEVAKRHNVPVEKVFDVFAAIIQVPLLRCPTDRRRQGKLATARIKEYNRAKKEIQDSRGSSSAGERPEVVVDSADIAQRLGVVEFPQEFTLSGSQ
ncbi:hypothetical protein EKO27_g1014 [Xylaria grammica]|uniref:Uncharacterized protein n=1 Tax=Xylaria grammica TaxID=363999 RepID=A0A439DI41_9PEZI|nr:hypothetical protein EKO27_g1014 [Xylaria grammica]